MVFSNLSAPEKDAFFGLLDEYFRSRPELFGPGGGDQGSGASTNALGLAAARAIVGGASAAATSSSSSLHNNNNNTIPVNKFSVNNPYRSVLTGIGGGGGGRINDDDEGDKNNASESTQALGRVAAATLAFQSGGQKNYPSSTLSPPTIPHRVPTSAGVVGTGGGSGAMMGRVPGAEVDKLVSTKVRVPLLGSTNILNRPRNNDDNDKTSILSSFRKKDPSVAAAALPSAFTAPKNTFGPPPVRRTTSATTTTTNTNTTTTSTSTSSSSNNNTGARSVPPPPPEDVEAETEYAEGEWAEVLYDYDSKDPADLSIETGSRVFVTTRSSEDWWSGQVEGQGKEGLFPVSYVRLL